MSQARSRVRRLGQTDSLRFVTHRTTLGIDDMISRNVAFKGVLASLVRHEIDPRSVL
jgi:hypothetical protein